MKISEVYLPVIGTPLTLECSVSVVPHLIRQPHMELIGPNDVTLASGNTSYTLDPVKAWHVGKYMCKAILRIGEANVHMSSQSNTLFLSVQSKLHYYII